MRLTVRSANPSTPPNLHRKNPHRKNLLRKNLQSKLCLVLTGLLLSACAGNPVSPGPGNTGLGISTAALDENTVVKSPNDDRDYRYITLDNSLRALLVSDSTTDKSAAALAALRGSYDEPSERPGLAHFLEHMLFIGCLLYTSPSPRDATLSRMPSSA